MEKFLYKDLAVMASGRFSLYELATQFEVSEDELRDVMRRYGITNTIARYAPWTAKEDYRLKEMRKQNLSNRDIASNLNRTVGMVEARIYKLNLPRKVRNLFSSTEIATVIMQRSMGVKFSDIAKNLGRHLPSVVTVYNREMKKNK